MHFRQLTVKDVRQETGDCVSIAFEVPPALREEFQFVQGQNITLRKDLSGEEVRRSYSICTAPDEGDLRVAVKRVAGGKFSNWVNSALKPGDKIDVLPPVGRFFTRLKPDQKKSYLAFAAGSGITPILSIIKTTLRTEPLSRFTLVYGNRTRGSILFRETLEALKNRYMERFRLVHILSRERTEVPLFQGHIDPEKCALLFQTLIDAGDIDECFICGPADMIFRTREFLEQRGVEPSKIHFELFQTPGAPEQGPDPDPGPGRNEPGPSDVRSSRVTVKLDGRSFDFDLPCAGESVLDAALAEGADLPYACKGGVCCTCRAKLAEGTVRMDQNYALTKEETDAGFILTCQSHPVSEKIVVDFDVR